MFPSHDLRAKKFISPFVKREGIIIVNGTDTDIFNFTGERMDKNGLPQYLYVRSSRDENKRWEEAWYYFQRKFFENSMAHLWIVGSFSQENVDYKFDLFGGAEERFKFFGMVEDKEEMAKLYRSCDILFLPYFIDACSNTLIEALVSGTKVYCHKNGGNGEILYLYDKMGRDFFSIRRMVEQYCQVFETLAENKTKDGFLKV